MDVLDSINAVLWHDNVLLAVLGVGILFTVWSGFAQVRSLTHGVALLRGKHDRADAPGAISHFQALSTALSATVGLGNIAGVALAISLGGPGAVFWMWVTGFVGMALKTTEVTQAMLYRNLDRPDEPRGGAMWIASRGFERMSPRLRGVGRFVAVLFCLTLLVSALTGGNMFQAWNTADITHSYLGVPKMASGAVMAVLVGLVVLGGIRRIGAVTGRLVPVMCVLYLGAGLFVLAVEIDQLPGLLREIVASAFRPAQAQGAFLGGTVGWAFLKGMQRALFSNEAGQGSSPIAHSAVKTAHPVSEGVVAGLEPFIDTIVVCTITALVILSSGIWNRPPDVAFSTAPAVAPAGVGTWTLAGGAVDAAAEQIWSDGDPVFALVSADPNPSAGNDLWRAYGRVVVVPETGAASFAWDPIESASEPRIASAGAYLEYKGATLTARAFDRIVGGLGGWLVPITVWLFATSTMISWSYYGEQGVRYLAGGRAVLPYRIAYCAAVFVSTTPLITTEAELDAVSTLGTGVMLVTNVPIMLVFGRQAMRAYRGYFAELKRSGR